MKRNTHNVFPFPRPWRLRCASMAQGSEVGGEDLASHAAAADEAGVATRAGGADHETSGGTQQPLSTSSGKPREKDSNGHAGEGMALKIGIYGMVNAMMAIPILYGYAAIIFRYVRVACGWRSFIFPHMTSRGCSPFIA